MHPYGEHITGRLLKKKIGLPVEPDFNVSFTPHKFQLPPFLRNNVTTHKPHQINAYPQYAWVFAPLCGGDMYTVSAKCGETKSGRFLSTKFQTSGWLKQNSYGHFKQPKLNRRFDDYMWLPVNPSTGVIEYTAEHFGYNYTPTPSFLRESKSGRHNQTILFVGASHSRYLANQVSQIYYNLTYGHDGCVEKHAQPPMMILGSNVSRFGSAKLNFGYEWFNKPCHEVLSNYGDYYDKYVVTSGHWDAGWLKNKPTSPGKFLESLLKAISILEELAKPGAEIFVVTVNQSPMGRGMLRGTDWRIPPLIDAYNDEIWSQVDIEYPITSTRSFRFKNFNRTFLLDSSYRHYGFNVGLGIRILPPLPLCHTTHSSVSVGFAKGIAMVDGR
jgi:hypothetical protein